MGEVKLNNGIIESNQTPPGGCEKCGAFAGLSKQLLEQLLTKVSGVWLCDACTEISRRDNAKSEPCPELRSVRPSIADTGKPKISIDDLNSIKLDIKVVESGFTAFRMTRQIRDPESADRVVNDLGVKLAATKPWARREGASIEDYGNAGICLKIRIQSGGDAFLATCAEYIVFREECIKSMNALRGKLGKLLAEKGFFEENIGIGDYYPSMLRDLADSLERLEGFSS